MEAVTLDGSSPDVEKSFGIVRECLVSALALDEAEAHQVRLHTGVSDLEKWDSLAHLVLILELEQRFEIEFSDAETVALSSVDAILRIIADKRRR